MENLIVKANIDESEKNNQYSIFDKCDACEKVFEKLGVIECDDCIGGVDYGK